MRKKYDIYTKYNKNKIINYCCSGILPNDVAILYGVTEKEICQLLIANGVPFSKKIDINNITLVDQAYHPSKIIVPNHIQKKIIKYYCLGLSTVQIGKICSYHWKIVLKILKANNLIVIHKKAKIIFSDEQKNEIFLLYENGKSVLDIVKKIGFSHPIISKLIKDKYHSLRSHNSYRSYLNDNIKNEIIYLSFNLKKSYKDITKILEIPISVVKSYINAYHKEHLICRFCNLVKEQNHFIRHNRCWVICNICALDISKRSSIKSNKKKYQKAKNNPLSRLHRGIASQIRNLFKCHNIKKDKKTFEYLGYTDEQLIYHIENQFEPWMNWNNYGKYDPKKWDDTNSNTWVWQIDHIVPVSSFEIDSADNGISIEEQIKKIWSLDNLRPLSAKLNLLDGVRNTKFKKPREY